MVAALLPPAPPKQVWLAEARGRVLAADLVATVSLPPFDNSAMDGYAVRAAEVAGQRRSTLPVARTSPPAGPTSRRSRRAPSRGS